MNSMDDDSEIARAMLMSLNLQDSPISKDVIRSLLECEEVSWIVRREEQSKYDSMTIRDHDGLLMLFSDDARGIFECVLQKSPQSREVYSLFRLDNDSVAEVGYHYLYTYLSPFFDHLQQRSLGIAVFQELVDLAKNSEEISPAHVAILTEFNDALCDPSVKSHVNSHIYPGKKTPLHLAVENVSIEGVVHLISCGASVCNTDEDGDTVFHYAARIPVFGGQVINAIPTSKEVLDRLNNAGEYALLLACRHGNYEVALRMVEAGARVDICDDIGYPIHYALTHSNTETVLAILERYPNQGKVKCVKYHGTPLHWAKSAEFIDMLIAREHDVDARSGTGDTALSVMVQRNRPMCAYTLMRAGADVNIPDSDGYTPLHQAVERRDLLTICRLTMANADVNKFNNVGESPRHLAANGTERPGGKSDVVIVLQEVSAKRCPPGTVECKEGCVDGGEDETTDKSYWKYYTMYHRDEMGLEEPSLQSMANFQESFFSSEVFQELEKTGTSMEQPLPPSPRDTKDTVLCLDGGGIRGLVILQFLDEIEKTSGKRITELFDWIVGTSTGGVIAIALSQGYTVSDIRKLYLEFKDKVFEGKTPYKADNLEECLKDFFTEDTTLDKYKYPKILVSSTLADRSPPALHFFRNFEPPVTSTSWNRANLPTFDPLPRPSEQLAWEAARASCAAPTYFAPFGRFLDGGLIANNPTLDALTEIQEYYEYNRSQGEPVREIGVVVSLGTGFTQPKKIAHVRWRPFRDIIWDAFALNVFKLKEGVEAAINLKDILVDQVTESRMRAVDRAEAWCRSINVPFFRLSPPLSQEIKLDVTCDILLRRMENETEMYIQRNTNQFENLASLIDSLSEQRASSW